MYTDFFKEQEKVNQQKYIELLKVTGSLSNLFAESDNPFLYYRAMENIFCKAFAAENLSRSDVSADAAKNKVGIGLKTFLHKNGRTYQKIAEFNRESYLLKKLSKEEIIYKVSEMRNERIEATKQICGLDDMMYHLITREKNSMNIYEEPMDYIDLNNLKALKTGSKTTIHFTDGINEYNFSQSKSTLLKRFDNKHLKFIDKFEVNILKDPFDFLLKQKMNMEDSLFMEEKEKIIDYIILPLYSSKSGKVEKKSGLNMWNARGRKRDKNEVYIPIPSWIHEKKKDFFKYIENDLRTDSFEVKLPNRQVLSMKVTQDGGKALQSDPNKELGRWILRDVLKLKPLELVTKQMLDKKGIDSIKLSKINNGLYYMDFLKVGSFEDYQDVIFEE